MCIDDVWIRFTARGTGYSIGIADTTVRKPGVFVGRCCMYVTFNAVDVRHDGQIVCETAVGVWSLVSTISFDALADGAGTCADCRQSFTNRKLQLINGYGMHFLFPTIKNGVLKKVQLRSWGEGSRFDGIPPGLDSGRTEQWTVLQQREMALLREGRSVLDPHGAENEPEIFAVAAEGFFERPAELRGRHPEPYELLSWYFALDPASRQN